MNKPIHISIPRTASRYIARAMRGQVRHHNHMPRKIFDSSMDRYEAFAFIRKPDDLLLSWWCYHRGIDFNKWVECGFPNIWWGYNTCKTIGVKYPYHQSSYVCNEEGAVIAERLYDFSKLSECAHEIANKYGFKVKNIRGSYRSKNKPVYDPEKLEEISRQVFADDWQLYERVQQNGVLETIPRNKITSNVKRYVNINRPV